MKVLWIVVAVVVLAFGAWFLLGQDADAPTDADGVTTIEVDDVVETGGGALFDTTLDDPEVAVGADDLVAVESSDLSPVPPYSGSGTATRSYDGQTFSHTVVAQLDPPAEGKFYEGWLVRNEPSLTFISTGELQPQRDSYSLSFSAQQDYSDHTNVVITEETSANGLDGVPEAHVLEGEF